MPRAFEIVLWPVMELLVWGFVALYLQNLSSPAFSKVGIALINAMIFWDVLYRSQQGVSISFIEDIWTQNIVNLLVSPLKIWEWVTATFLYGTLKTLLIMTILSALAFGLYQFNLITNLHFFLIPLFFNLLLFGWALGIFTSSLVIRWGHAAEALIWGIPFLIQPLSAIYYPVSVLPGWLGILSKILPSTYVFEGMRAVTQTGTMPWSYFWIGVFLNGVYFVVAGFFFRWMHHQARLSGRLGRLGMD
jgi:ABC-2 type transport system permease protein